MVCLKTCVIRAQASLQEVVGIFVAPGVQRTRLAIHVPLPAIGRLGADAAVQGL